MKKIAFIINSTKLNKYSYNALLGAMESQGLLEMIDIFFYEKKKDKGRILENCVEQYFR